MSGTSDEQLDSASPTPPLARRDYLTCSDIFVAFRSHRVLQGAQLTVAQREIHALIGPNGAGKTTLANVITGHVRSYQGKVRLDGREVTGPVWRRCRLGIGRKFQVPRTFPRLTPSQHVDLASRGNPALPLAEVPAAELSHGERQRLEWLTVSAQSTPLIVLDEPTAGLTRRERQDLAEALLDHRDRLGATLLIVEHDLDFVASVADRVSFMEDGRVTVTGGYERVRTDPRVREIYLGASA